MKSPSYLPALFLGLCLCPFSGQPAYASPRAEQAVAPPSPTSSAEITFPGPLRSFLRMAAISQKASAEEVLPFLARNVVMIGYRRGKPTEYLLLLQSYLEQARELLPLAGPEGVIRVSSCREAQPLLAVLGYRLKQGCGSRTSVETADPERAFLTIDSGFPLADLEETLRSGKPFVYPFSFTVPALFTPNDWIAKGKRYANNVSPEDQELIGALLGDPDLARLYWALSRMDPETRRSLRLSPGLPGLLPFAPILDFYGRHISIRSGRVLVPGGTPAEPAWKDLIGVSPDSAGQFVSRLLERDQGWLAVYFDVLSRVSQARQVYFTEPRRLQRFYLALRGGNASPGPARSVFRPDASLLLLVNRLQFDATGEPHVPGDLAAWKEILRRTPDNGSKILRQGRRLAGRWNDPEQLVAGMFGLSRAGFRDGPVQLYLTLSEMDRGRPPEKRLTPETVRLLGDKFPRFGNQYLLFSEFDDLDNESITRFLEVAENVDGMRDRVLRAETLGVLQAHLGLWQILARQGQIPKANLNGSWQRMIRPFAEIRSAGQLFDVGRGSLGELLRAATGRSDLSQDEIIALLAGPDQQTSEGQQVWQAMAGRMRAVMDDQRLVSLDTLFALADGLKQEPQEGKDDALIQLAGELREFEMPRPMFTTRERSAWASGFFYNRHTESQMQTDLTKAIRTRDPDEVAEAHGQLALFLRDALVGLNYAYYAPPGAQLLHTSPLLVRFHDFSGNASRGLEQSWQTPRLVGRGNTPSGGAHLAGSLANLPYVLAEVEQGLFVPENIQSLIWEDLVPELVAGAVLPRWWNVSREELRAVALYQRTGEELLTAAAGDETLREPVMSILSDRMLPERLQRVEEALRAGLPEQALAQTTPAETFYLTAKFRPTFPADTHSWGTAGRELEDLVRRFPEETSWERLSRDFGMPHPALAHTYARELLDVKPFPSLLGYASRLLAESSDSNNLYWARLADEMNYAPVVLNLLIPELTRHMVGKISATHPEDWQAVLRAMRETGEEFREGKFVPLTN